MSMFEAEHTASAPSLPRKVLAVLMSIVLAVGLNPLAKAPESAFADQGGGDRCKCRPVR